MEFLQECVTAFAEGDLSTCKPLGLDLDTWFSLFGLSVIAVLALFGQSIIAVVKTAFGRFAKKPGPIPHPQTGNLFGRERDIVRLDDAFSGAPAAVAITGQGGIGKTALAEEYGRQRVKDGRYRDWILVSTASDTDMANDLRTTAAVLGVDDNPNAATMIALTYKAMAESGDRWLVILDNVDDEDVQRRVLNNLRPADRIDHLVTSRIQDWHDKAYPVDLDLLEPDDALGLLKWASGREVEGTLRALAVDTLERLPLALVVAGADLRNMNIDISAYTDEFKKRLREAPQVKRYDKSIYVAVVGSVERLSENAQAFLKLAAYMDPSDIDPNHLVRGAAAIRQRERKPLPSPYATLVEGGVTLASAVGECERHSLLTPANWEDQDTFRTHRMTQLVLRDWMGADARKAIIGLAGGIGAAQISGNPQFDTDSWPIYRRLAPHARALAECGPATGGDDAKLVAKFIHEMTLFFGNATGDLRLVLQLSEQNVRNVARIYGENSEHYSTALGLLANTQNKLGCITTSEEAVLFDQQAEQNYRKALKFGAEKQGYELHCAYILNNLGYYYSERNRFSEAFAEFSKALQIREEYGAGDELLGTTHGNIGALYADWANIVVDSKRKANYRHLALVHNTKSLELIRSALGEMCFSTTISLHNIAMLCVYTDEPKKAIDYSVRAVAISLAMLEQKVIGSKNHPTLVTALKTLMLILRTLNRDPNEAEELARAEIPNVIADHEKWKARKAQEAKEKSEEQNQDENAET